MASRIEEGDFVRLKPVEVKLTLDGDPLQIVVEIAGRRHTLYADSDAIEEIIKGPRKRMPKLFDKPD